MLNLLKAVMYPSYNGCKPSQPKWRFAWQLSMTNTTMLFWAPKHHVDQLSELITIRDHHYHRSLTA